MKVWIDGDACPKAIKQILFRAAIRRKIPVLIVANHFANIPSSPFINRILVEAGFDAADNYIEAHVTEHDLVITADIILADRAVEKKAFALNPRGTLYTANNIKQILAVRNINESLRSSGLIQGGDNKLSSKEIQNFSNCLDKILQAAH